jgi:putative ABC transport system permease protein
MARLAYWVLLMLYPRDVRRVHGQEMWHTFARRLEDIDGLRERMRLWSREWAGAVRHALPYRFGKEAHPLASSRKESLVQSFLSDLRYALRGLRRAPGVALIILVTLALGIGASTAVFTVVKGVLLDPLSYPESDRLVAVWGRFLPESGFDFPVFPLSPPEVFDYRDQTTALEGIAAVTTTTLTLTGDGDGAERVRVASMSANGIPLLGVSPVVGRAFTDAEAIPNGPDIGLISYDLWQSRFGGDATIIGRTIRLNAVAVEVIGVMPRGFAYPRDAQVWLPLQLDPAFPSRASHFLTAFGRLKNGATHQDVTAELEVIRERWREEFPDIHTGHFLFALPLIDNYVQNVRPALLALFGAVGVVMLIVCANAASVLLARGEHRQRELAVRAALGAGSSRLMRQLLTETMVFVLAGTLGGILLAGLAVPALLSLAVNMPRAENVRIDLPVLMFTIAVAAICCLVIGLAPAFQAARMSAHGALRDRVRAATAGLGRQRFRRGLVVLQVALAVLLVIGSGLTVRSFERLLSVPKGFDANSVLVARLGLSAVAYDTDEKSIRFWEDLLERLRTHPAVIGATVATSIPIFNSMPNEDFQIDGRPPPPPGAPAHSGYLAWADPSFFDVMRMPLRRGRLFDPSDGRDAQLVTVINETMARTFWPDEEALGQRIRWGPDAEWVTVIGIVADARVSGVNEDIRPVRYIPLPQAQRTGRQPLTLSVALRTTGDPVDVAPSLRSTITELDANLVPADVQTLEDVVETSVAQPRLLMTLMTLFAIVALALGGVGIFGVMSFTVARRAREIGIRMALGADRARMAAGVLLQGLGLAGVGVALGLAGSLASVRFIRSMLYDVSPYDPVAFAAVPFVLLIAATLACLIPALRAMRVDLVNTLKSE